MNNESICVPIANSLLLLQTMRNKKMCVCNTSFQIHAQCRPHIQYQLQLHSKLWQKPFPMDEMKRKSVGPKERAKRNEEDLFLALSFDSLGQQTVFCLFSGQLNVCVCICRHMFKLAAIDYTMPIAFHASLSSFIVYI